MTSADFLQFVVTMLRFECVYSFTPARPPRVSIITFTSYICCIYTLIFGQYWSSFCVGNSSVSSMPYMLFLFVRERFCLRLLSDSASRQTPLSLANSSYYQACSWLSPLSDYVCRAHTKKQEHIIVFLSNLLNGGDEGNRTPVQNVSHIQTSTVYFVLVINYHDDKQP